MVGEAAGERQRLQNTHRCRRALDDGGEQGGHHKAQQGVLQPRQDRRKFRHLCQRAYGVAHHHHAVHEYGEAHQYGADAFLLILFAHHHHHNADDGQDGRKVFGLQHLQPHIAALDAGKGEDPRRQRRADIGAEDDIQRLAKLHNAGIDQTHQHYRDRRGGLHRYGDGGAQQHTHQRAGRHRFQQLLQLSAGHLFQIAGHDTHAEQKKSQTQHQPQ